MKLKQKHSAETVIESLNKANVVLLEMNKYKAVYYDEVLKDIDLSLGTKLNQKYITLSGIKKMISDTK